jgi:EAL domain-containing protein (putative c-di-GMP-specific phosphodiesterase class I)/CheY-like chemotaxis protein
MTIASAKVAGDSAAPDSANGPVAYVIDDDAAVAALVGRMLRAVGYAAIDFTDPFLGLKQLKTANIYVVPKLIVLDLSLGKFDAVSALDELLKLRFLGKILLISGKDESTLLDVQMMGMSRGLSMLPPLKKPFRLDDLKKCLSAEAKSLAPSSDGPSVDTVVAAIEGAIANGKLAPWYKSRFDLKTMSKTDASVELYENHPTNGFQSLGDMILPPDNALNHPFSRILLRGLMRDWKQHFSGLPKPLRLSAKLPLSVVTTPGFLALARETIAAHPGFPGLIVEVGDWKHFNNDRGVREVAAQLKLYGILLAVDDLGAVYASITEGSKFSFAELALHSKQVAGCGQNQAKKQLCQNAIYLAHTVGATVCADGVTDRQDLETLLQLKCDVVQGPLIGKPQAADELRRSLLGVPSTPAKMAGADGDPAAKFDWPGAAP